MALMGGMALIWEIHRFSIVKMCFRKFGPLTGGDINGRLTVLRIGKHTYTKIHLYLVKGNNAKVDELCFG